MDKGLKTLEEHNAEQLRKAIGVKAPRPNGIACPSCGRELMDTCPGSVLTSIPPKALVHCVCGYQGHRIL